MAAKPYNNLRMETTDNGYKIGYTERMPHPSGNSYSEPIHIDREIHFDDEKAEEAFKTHRQMMEDNRKSHPDMATKMMDVTKEETEA